ncbi:MAG: VOC family protein, partial [Pseudomonadales bacterium]
MIDANLTRFGPATLVLGNVMEAKSSDAFKALQGPAQLIIRADRVQSLSITLNGSSVVESGVPLSRGEQVREVQLASDNTIDISCTGDADGSLTVRIKQTASADIGLLRQGYFGLNTSDMERQRKFYDLLGFKGEIYPAGPETSESFAQSLGFKDNYLIHVSLHSLENPPTMPFVDTVQFRGDSYRDEPPYAKLNHLGMSYATYSTTNLDGDYTWLRARGVEFLSAPATAPNGERFVFFKDKDGAFLKLIAVEGESRADQPNLRRLVNTNMNVSDLERSREFYRLLGFTESMPASQSG